jgi:hypothetical protein
MRGESRGMYPAKRNKRDECDESKKMLAENKAAHNARL